MIFAAGTESAITRKIEAYIERQEIYWVCNQFPRNKCKKVFKFRLEGLEGELCKGAKIFASELERTNGGFSVSAISSQPRGGR